MTKTFRQHVDALLPLFRELMAVNPVTVPTLPRKMPKAGIYLFSNGSKHLYVGRTNRLRKRLQEHCRPSSGHNSAPFAFLLAREATGLKKATYVAKGSRADLEKQPRFRKAYSAAKDRVREMDVRFVAEADPIRQALLEMYTALELQTKYNDFDNH